MIAHLELGDSLISYDLTWKFWNSLCALSSSINPLDLEAAASLLSWLKFFCWEPLGVKREEMLSLASKEISPQDVELNLPISNIKEPYLIVETLQLLE